MLMLKLPLERPIVVLCYRLLGNTFFELWSDYTLYIHGYIREEITNS